MTQATGTTITIGAPEPTKKEIIERLFSQGHITFNEMWTLLQNEPEVRYIPMMPQIDLPTVWPLYPYDQPPVTYTTSNDNDNQRVHNEGGGTGSPESH